MKKYPLPPEFPIWKKFLTDFSNPQSPITNPQKVNPLKISDRPTCLSNIYKFFWSIYKKIIFCWHVDWFFYWKPQTLCEFVWKICSFLYFWRKMTDNISEIYWNKSYLFILFWTDFSCQSPILNPQSPIWFDRPTFLPTFSS